MKNSSPYNFITDMSDHLFWDMDRELLDIEKNKKIIIQRVIEYGVLSDWQIIYNKFGIKDIADVATNMKELDDKTLAFISFLSKTPIKQFRCYDSKQLPHRYWNF